MNTPARCTPHPPPFLKPIAANPRIDPRSEEIITRNLEGFHGIALEEFGIPFYRADELTPRYSVECLQEDWGSCSQETYGPRPLTEAMIPHIGSDGAMVVIDESPRAGERVGRSVDGYWIYAWNDGQPTTQFGDISDLDGMGNGDTSTGSGFSRAAGVVRAFEIEAGRIDHAFTFASQYCQTDDYRFPATKTDGKYSGIGAIPEGARVQLDPSLNPDDYNLTPAERTIFVALQEFGAYVNDCSGAPIAFSFEDIPGDPGTSYENAGLYDYYELTAIPWEDLRVLASWDGQ